uniref:Patatin n=1 Tax=Ananas comosus var. bracteatus TaxID=296719 RepID=A0A6V7QEC1_ANACO|nr:unnamed protein product [Ananas comosus var. bracteatus]
MAAAAALIDPSFDVDKLSYEIFSILESKFLFGYDEPKLFSSAAASLPETPTKTPARCAAPAGRVRILSIDGGGRAADGILAAVALSRLEASLRERSGDPGSRIADYFDVAAGSGAGGVLAAMLFARGPDGRSMFSVEEALGFLARNLRRGALSGERRRVLRGIFRRSSPAGMFRRVFGEATLRDTVGPVLIPCYDLATGAPFLFSRADAVEGEGFDFRLREVCAATCAAAGAAVEMRSVDGRARIAAVGAGVAMGNPAAAAITHVLNNKREFPLAAGVENLLVVSLGCGEAMRVNLSAAATPTPTAAPPPAAEMLRIAAESAADMVDQAVAMAFGHSRTSNYIRIQATKPFEASKPTTDAKKATRAAEEMLAQRNAESVLFRGKKLSERTNAEKLEWCAVELVKEHGRRKTSPIPVVAVKSAGTPRLSSATVSTVTTSSLASSTAATPSPPPSHHRVVDRD